MDLTPEQGLWMMAASCYFGCGLVWTLWNSTSRMFRASVLMSEDIKHPWIPYVALVIGILTWPLGLIGWFILDAIKRRKEHK